MLHRSSYIISATTIFTYTHIVGNGAQGSAEVSQKTNSNSETWPFVPINDVDTRKMAGGATDYEIQTQVDFIDIIVSGLTSGIVTSRNVTVKK